jgi:hypothetical protein
MMAMKSVAGEGGRNKFWWNAGEFPIGNRNPLIHPQQGGTPNRRNYYFSTSRAKINDGNKPKIVSLEHSVLPIWQAEQISYFQSAG